MDKRKSQLLKAAEYAEHNMRIAGETYNESCAFCLPDDLPPEDEGGGVYAPKVLTKGQQRHKADCPIIELRAAIKDAKEVHNGQLHT